jgi:hypothetical protein
MCDIATPYPIGLALTVGVAYFMVPKERSFLQRDLTAEPENIKKLGP